MRATEVANPYRACRFVISVPLFCALQILPLLRFMHHFSERAELARECVLPDSGVVLSNLLIYS